MTFYLLTSLFLLFGSFLSLVFKNFFQPKSSKILDYVLVGVLYGLLIFMASIRVDSGFDYISYYNVFLGNNTLDLEPLYEAIQSVTRLTSYFWVHLLIISILAITPKIIFFYKCEVKNVAFALFLYYLVLYLNTDMGVIRQGVAVGLVAIATIYWTENRKFFAAIWVLFGAFFHLTAVLFLPLLWLADRIRSISFTTITFFVISSLILMVLFYTFSDQFFSLLAEYGGRYSVYALEEQGAGLTLGLYMKLILLYIFYCSVFKNPMSTGLDSNLLKLYMVGICVFLVFNFLPIIAARIGSYFKIFEIVLLCRMIVLSRRPSTKMLLSVFAISWSYAQFYKFFSLDVVKLYYIPYNNIFF